MAATWKLEPPERMVWGVVAVKVTVDVFGMKPPIPAVLLQLPPAAMLQLPPEQLLPDVFKVPPVKVMVDSTVMESTMTLTGGTLNTTLLNGLPLLMIFWGVVALLNVM